ncbi:MAG: SDR family NAD(P)-dependent oxidoreductase [Opitutaceae bacterium]|nr:SDR family NAD(P)-dependent oxidoreductase [Opitutaceae bacterium]
MNPTNFFITGASGFVGRHVCERLRAAGHPVRALVRRRDDVLTALGVELVRGDLDDVAPWRSRLAGVDCIIHCAARASFRNGYDYETTNVEGTRRLLNAAREMAPGLGRFVFVSTIGAIDRHPGDACVHALDEGSQPVPSSAYGRSKLSAERVVRESGLPFSIVRPAMVVGGDMRADSHFAVFSLAAARNSLVGRLAWPGQFSVVHVDDLAAALELCATNPAAAGRTFFCAGSPVALRDHFKLVRPDVSRLPLGWAAPLARRFPRLCPFGLKAMLLPALTASDAALRQLGWQPVHSPADALAGVIARERARADPDADPGGQTVITGAASGLGRALVDRLAPRRLQLLLVDRDERGLEDVKARHPHCRTAVLDLADDAAIAQFVQGPEWRAHPVRELYACAGLGVRGPVLDADPAKHARVFQVNVLARLALAHAALPAMLREHFGRIVFVSSSSAFQPLPYMATYAASNAALLSLGEAWASELADTGVHLLSVCPGGMQTNFQRTAGVKQPEGERLMPPEEVANEILRALRLGRMTAIISLRAHAMSWAARVLPRKTSVALWKRLMTQLR